LATLAVVRHAIDAAGLTRMYGRSPGVVEVDLVVERGERFGFLGPNGSGKTTFIRLALGLIRPTAGRVRVMGHDVAEERMAALGEVGYLPGELGLYAGLSGRRTLDALARLHPRPPSLRMELCEVLGLAEADLRRRVREYSRGMKQKLGLVAALQHDPPLAILDEPTTGLDPVVQGRLLGWLAARARAGRTLFFSSHVLAEVEELCDRVAMVREGRLLRVGPVDDLRRAGGRTVDVRFSAPVDPSRYRVAGVGAVAVRGARHRFTLQGDPRPLLATLAELPVADVAIERAGLEEAFRHLYHDPADRPAA
jgi:ABC-2 type transport system ATP-binding protein